MRLLIVRHGDPDYENDALTEKGRIEAALLAKRLKKEKIDYFYVSPYGRARETAAPTLKEFQKEEIIYDWLHEFSYPVELPDGTMKNVPWDFKPSQWTKDEYNFTQQALEENPLLRAGKIQEKYDEVIAQLDLCLKQHGYTREGRAYRVDRANTETIVFFCHFGLECVLLSRLLNIPPMLLWHGTVAAPSAVTSLYTEEREKGTAYFRMNYFGDVSHLTMAGEEVSFQARFCEIYDDMSKRH